MKMKAILIGATIFGLSCYCSTCVLDIAEQRYQIYLQEKKYNIAERVKTKTSDSSPLEGIILPKSNKPYQKL
jgi:hypothetical protein